FSGVIFISPQRVNAISPDRVSATRPRGSNTRGFSMRLVHYAVELNFPEIVNKINNIFFGITPFDRSLLYILKLGLNQSEAARLLNRKRSTISHRLAILEKTYQIAPKSILEIDSEFVRDLHQNETLS
ncbi:MAG: hypothetical protein MJZ40_03010, partial [Bacteroidaceae bacterium]|nr:hypothetical protein [Bacteroidaceae bacterium]